MVMVMMIVLQMGCFHWPDSWHSQIRIKGQAFHSFDFFLKRDWCEVASDGSDDKIAVIFIFIISFYMYFCGTPSFLRPHSNGTNSQDFSSSFQKHLANQKYNMIAMFFVETCKKIKADNFAIISLDSCETLTGWICTVKIAN